MAHGDVGRGKWRGNWRMDCVASTLHTTSEHGVSSITTADAHTSAVSSRLNWAPPPGDLNGLVRFARKTKSGFCACAITFQTQSSTGFSRTFTCNVATNPDARHHPSSSRRLTARMKRAVKQLLNKWKFPERLFGNTSRSSLERTGRSFNFVASVQSVGDRNR